jgi:hypothetical protein
LYRENSGVVFVCHKAACVSGSQGEEDHHVDDHDDAAGCDADGDDRGVLAAAALLYAVKA